MSNYDIPPPINFKTFREVQNWLVVVYNKIKALIASAPLTAVTTDSSLTGDGTGASPLTVAAANTTITSLGSIASLKPASDSTTAIKIYKADGTTAIANIDTTNGRFMFGSGDAPSNPVNLIASTGPTFVSEVCSSTTANNIQQRRSRGTTTAKTALQAGDIIGQNTFAALDNGSPGAYATSGSIQFLVTQNVTSTARGTACAIKTTPAGSTTQATGIFIDDTQYVGIGSSFDYIATPQERLHVAGNIRIDSTYGLVGTDSDQVSRKFIAFSTDKVILGYTDVTVGAGAATEVYSGTDIIFYVNGFSGTHSNPLTIGSSAVTVTDAINFTFGSTTGTKIGGAGCKLALYGATPVTRPTALTAQVTTITHTAPGTPDYAIQDMTNVAPYGFVTQDEGNTVLKVIANLQTRVAELETKLQSIGALS